MRVQIALTSLVLVLQTLTMAWLGFREVQAASNATLSELTPAGLCLKYRLDRQVSEDPRARERWVSAEIAEIRPYRRDMTEEQLRRAEESQYDARLSKISTLLEYWCAKAGQGGA